jgi:hypothetical protein
MQKMFSLHEKVFEKKVNRKLKVARGILYNTNAINAIQICPKLFHRIKLNTMYVLLQGMAMMTMPLFRILRKRREESARVIVVIWSSGKLHQQREE